MDVTERIGNLGVPSERQIGEAGATEALFQINLQDIPCAAVDDRRMDKFQVSRQRRTEGILQSQRPCRIQSQAVGASRQPTTVHAQYHFIAADPIPHRNRGTGGRAGQVITKGKCVGRVVRCVEQIVGSGSFKLVIRQLIDRRRVEGAVEIDLNFGDAIRIEVALPRHFIYHGSRHDIGNGPIGIDATDAQISSHPLIPAYGVDRIGRRQQPRDDLVSRVVGELRPDQARDR